MKNNKFIATFQRIKEGGGHKALAGVQIFFHPWCRCRRGLIKAFPCMLLKVLQGLAGWDQSSEWAVDVTP